MAKLFAAVKSVSLSFSSGTIVATLRVEAAAPSRSLAQKTAAKRPTDVGRSPTDVNAITSVGKTRSAAFSISLRE